MVKDIKELNFPQYATLAQATVNLQDMGEKIITSQLKIAGEVTPDFSTDWEVEFQGEKYIMPLRQPQGAKDNTSLDSTLELTFQHWAIYQLKRWMFFTVQPIESGTAIADQYIASVSLNLTDFCALFSQVLQYYYGDSITIDLNPNWESKDEPTGVEINHSYIWDVLIQLYKLFGVRWYIEPKKDSEHYIIKIGYPAKELDHIFEYGFKGGLLKVERQVQDDNIRNMLLGRGGSKNLPYRYFKDKDNKNPSFPADPDWIPELANIYFDCLRGATFRSYVQGWKAKHYRGSTTKKESYAPWAWEKGYTDAKFNPIEYVKDDASIVKYGPLLGGLENNEDIYPSIQGVVLDPYGRIDEAIDVEQITSDEVDEPEKSDPVIVVIGGAEMKLSLNPKEGRRITLKGADFEVPEGKEAKFSYTVEAYSGNSGRVEVRQVIVNVYDKNSENRYGDMYIPAGSYYYEFIVDVLNVTEYRASTTVGTTMSKIIISDPVDLSVAISNTFNIWVKNIWETSKNSNESNNDYAKRVWEPILGDREKNEAKVIFSSGMLSTSQDYEFIIPKNAWPQYDTSKTLVEKDGKGNIVATYSSHWRITLGKSDADLESTGLYVPSTKRQGKQGDHFFFVGIDMPSKYTQWSERKLDDYKTDSVLKISDIKPTWVVSLDKVRIANKQNEEAQTLLSQLKIGSSIRLYDKRFIGGSQQEILYLQSITYTYNTPSTDTPALIPNVEIVLSDKYEIVANPVQTLRGEVSSIQKQIGSISNIEQIVRSIGDRKYLRKDTPDRTPYSMEVGERITTYGGVQVGDYASGIAGFGALIDKYGNAELENIIARGSVTTPVLNYNRVDISIGDDWSAPGGGVIETVDTIERLASLKLEEGEIGTVKVGDICMGIFHSLIQTDNATMDSDDGKGNRTFAGFATVYFRITEVFGNRDVNFRYELRPLSASFIKQIHPMGAMKFVAYGSFTDPSRRTSRYSTRTYQRFLRDVSDWEFTKENIAAQFGDLSNLSLFGLQMSGYSAYLDNIYLQGLMRSLDGSFIVDSKSKSLLLASSGSGMGIAFNPEQGFKQGKVYDPATGRFEKEYDIDLIEQTASNAEQTANTAQQAADTAAREAQEAKDFIDNTLPSELANINKKLDGVVEHWFYAYSPTLQNEPAASWIRDGLQAQHEGDTFVNTQAYVDDQTTPDAGKAWRWVKEGNAYKWTPIADSDAVKALQEAAKALETADGKCRTFVVQPTPPYDVGDLWMQGPSGDAMRCIKSRQTGAFDNSDWTKASKYTDDTVAKEAKNEAAVAQKTADDAKTSAKAATDKLTTWASDSYISPQEKTSLRQQQKDIQSEYQEIIASASKYAVATADYTNAYNAANAALTKYTAATPESIAVGADYDRIASYYTARGSILDAISEAMKAYSEKLTANVQVSSRNLVPDSRTITISATSTNYNFIARLLTVEVEGGEELALSVDQIDVLAGSPTAFTAAIYNNGYTERLAPVGQLTSENRKHTFRIDAGSVRQKAMLLLYAGAYGSTAGNSVRYSGVSLAKGNKPMPLWMEAPEDADARIDAAQQAADTANEAIDAMNDDGVFDIAEKQTIRTQWERISGGVSTSSDPAYAAGGSYSDTYDAAAVVKVDGQALVRAFYALRTTLHGMQLYSNTNTPDFDRKKMAAQFTAYQSAELDLLNRISAKQAAIAADAIEIGGANLLDDTESRTVTAPEGSNYAQIVFKVGAVAVGDQLALSVGKIDVLAGSPTAFTALLYDYATNTRLDANQPLNTLTTSRRTYVYTATRACENASLLLYAGLSGSTAGNSVRYDQIMLVKGNKPMLSWSPSPADVRRQIEAEVAKEAKNVEYLRTAFAQDDTVSFGGMTVGSFLGVKNSSGAVIAGMSGKNFLTGKDFTLNDKSCPWLFGGANSVTEANSAKFRAYTDGSVAMSALIAENGCTIGGFTIHNHALYNEYSSTINGVKTAGSVGIYESGLIDIRQAMGSVYYSYLYVGFPALSKMEDGRIPAIAVDVSSNYHAGMLLKVPAGASAVEIPSGCVRGFRRSLRYTTASITLTALDDVIVANNSGAITITLPSAPQNGEDFEILKNSNSGQITVIGNGVQIVSLGVSISTSQVLIAGDYAVRLTYSSTLGRWLMRKSNGKLT